MTTCIDLIEQARPNAPKGSFYTCPHRRIYRLKAKGWRPVRNPFLLRTVRRQQWEAIKAELIRVCERAAAAYDAQQAEEADKKARVAANLERADKEWKEKRDRKQAEYAEEKARSKKADELLYEGHRGGGMSRPRERSAVTLEKVMSGERPNPEDQKPRPPRTEQLRDTRVVDGQPNLSPEMADHQEHVIDRIAKRRDEKRNDPDPKIVPDWSRVANPEEYAANLDPGGNMDPEYLLKLMSLPDPLLRELDADRIGQIREYHIGKILEGNVRGADVSKNREIVERLDNILGMLGLREAQQNSEALLGVVMTAEETGELDITIEGQDISTLDKAEAVRAAYQAEYQERAGKGESTARVEHMVKQLDKLLGAHFERIPLTHVDGTYLTEDEIREAAAKFNGKGTTFVDTEDPNSATLLTTNPAGK